MLQFLYLGIRVKRHMQRKNVFTNSLNEKKNLIKKVQEKLVIFTTRNRFVVTFAGARGKVATRSHVTGY